MAHDRTAFAALPRFTRWMKLASLYTGGVWVALLILQYVAGGNLAARVIETVALAPRQIVPGMQLWRLGSYALVEDPTNWSVLWTVLAFWLIGSPAEQAVGARRVLELLGIGVLGGALFGLVAGLVAPGFFGGVALGLGPASSALLAGWGFGHGDQPVTMFGIGPMPARKLALGLGVVFGVMALTSHSVSGAASIGGLVAGAGWMWFRTRTGPRRPVRTKARGRRAGHLGVIPGGRGDGDEARDRDPKKMWN